MSSLSLLHLFASCLVQGLQIRGFHPRHQTVFPHHLHQCLPSMGKLPIGFYFLPGLSAKDYVVKFIENKLHFDFHFRHHLYYTLSWFKFTVEFCFSCPLQVRSHSRQLASPPIPKTLVGMLRQEESAKSKVCEFSVFQCLETSQSFPNGPPAVWVWISI